jgi:hypothetical protein
MTKRALILLIFGTTVPCAVLIGVIFGQRSGAAAGAMMAALVLALPLVMIPVVMMPMAVLFGWQRLARRFPAVPPEADADRDHLTSIAIGSRFLNYNNCIDWSADDHHLHLSLPFPFSAGHAPMSIPWDRVELIEPSSFGRVMLAGDGFRIWVPRRLARREMALRDKIGPVGSATPEESPGDDFD